MALGDKTAWLLGHDYNFCAEENSRYDKWDAPDDKEVYRLVNKEFNTSIYIKYEPP